MTKRRLAIVLLALVFSSFVAAETKSAVDAFVQDFPDNVDLRKQYRNSVITATKELAWAFSERVLPSAGAGQVKIKVQKRAADFLVQFVNARDGRFDESLEAGRRDGGIHSSGEPDRDANCSGHIRNLSWRGAEGIAWGDSRSTRGAKI